MSDFWLFVHNHGCLIFGYLCITMDADLWLWVHGRPTCGYEYITMNVTLMCMRATKFECGMYIFFTAINFDLWLPIHNHACQKDVCESHQIWMWSVYIFTTINFDLWLWVHNHGCCNDVCENHQIWMWNVFIFYNNKFSLVVMNT
jgi:hypothetical protein